jgi:hypothetical protein
LIEQRETSGQLIAEMGKAVKELKKQNIIMAQTKASNLIKERNSCKSYAKLDY